MNQTQPSTSNQITPPASTIVPEYVEDIMIRIETIEEPKDGDYIFTAASSNHNSNFSTADTCCTCTT